MDKTEQLETKKYLSEKGYCIIQNVLNEDECDSYIEKLECFYAKYSPYHFGKGTKYSEFITI